MSKEELNKIIKEYVEENNIKQMKVDIEDLYEGRKKVEIFMK